MTMEPVDFLATLDRTRFEALLDDALVGMRTLAPGSVDVVFVDIPFSSGTRKEGSKGVRKAMTRAAQDEDWFDSDSLTVLGFVYLMRLCALEWRRVLRRDGHVFAFIDWRMEPHLAGAIESADLRQAESLVWNKGQIGMGRYFRRQHERILHFTKGIGTDPLRRDVPDVLTHAPIRGGINPTEKPVGLLREVLSVVAAPGAVVLDCFSGSGSTGEAALSLGCHFIGMDREPVFQRATERRCEAALSALSLFPTTPEAIAAEDERLGPPPPLPARIADGGALFDRATSTPTDA